MNEVYFWQYFENKSLIFAHWGDNVSSPTLFRLSWDFPRIVLEPSSLLRRTLNLSSFYFPSTLPLFCIYQKTKKSTFSTIINFELSIVNSKSSELWIVILRWTFPLAIPLLPPYYRLTSIPIFYFHRTSTTYSQHIANIYSTYSLHIHCIYLDTILYIQKDKIPHFFYNYELWIMTTHRILCIYLAYIFPQRTLDVPWTYLGRTLDVPWTYGQFLTKLSVRNP